MTLHPPPFTLPPQRRAVKDPHDFFELSKGNAVSEAVPRRCTVSLQVESGLDSLAPPHLRPCSLAIHGELLVVHFKIFPACFESLTAKTTICFFEPASAPV